MRCTQKTDLVNDVDQKADPGAINAESEAKDPEVLKDGMVNDIDQEAGPGAVTVDQKVDPGAVNAENEAKDPEVLKDDVVIEGICQTIVTHLQTLLVIITCQNNMELVLAMSDA